MADETEKRIISIEIDQAAKDKLVKGLQEIQAAQKRVATEGLALGRSAAEIAKDLHSLNKEERDLKAILSTVEKDIDAQTASFKAASTAAGDYESRLKSIKQGGADLSGDIASSLGGIRGATSAVGLGGITDAPLGIAQAAADLGEFLPKLKVGLEAAASSGSGLISTVSGLAASALPAAGASFGAIAVAIAPIAIVGVAVAGALALVSAGLDEASKAAARQAEAQVAANEAVNELLGSGATTGEALQSTVDQAQAIDIAYQNLVDAQDEYEAYLQRRGGNVLQALGDAVGFYGDEEQVFADAVARTKAEFTNLTTAYDETTQAIQAGEFAANDIARAEADLAKTREEDAQRAIQEAESANQRILALNEQRDSAIENRLIARSNAAQSTKLESGFAEEDEKKELLDFEADKLKIIEAGHQKELALAKEIADLPAQQAKDLALVTGKGTEQLNKLNSDYFQNQIKATQDFAKESGRINQEVAKNAKRIAEDLRDSLSNAARDNDVVAFLQLQRDGQKEIKRNAEDAKDAEKQRQEDFLDQQAEQRQAFQQRQQEILRQVEDEKQKVLQAYAEKKAAIEQQIQQERVNTQQAIQNAQTRYQQEEALENQQAQRNAERLKLRDAQENAAFQRQLTAIQSKVNAELAGLARIQAAASAMGSGMNKTAYGKPTSSYVSPYANIPTASSGGFGGKIGSSTVVVNQNNVIGDVATASQVTAALKQQAQAVFGAMQGGISSAQGN